MSDTDKCEGDSGDSGAGGSGAGDSGDSGDADSEYKLETAPFDPRFPNQNQAKHCYSSFLDYHRCVKARGEDFAACKYFSRVYKSLCPNFWTAKWQEQIESGTFPGRI